MTRRNEFKCSLPLEKQERFSTGTDYELNSATIYSVQSKVVSVTSSGPMMASPSLLIHSLLTLEATTSLKAVDRSTIDETIILIYCK